MGYVQADYAAPGTPVSLMVRGKSLSASVVPMPFFPHRYAKGDRAAPLPSWERT
jgi:aminomethyltransferase